MSSGPENSDGQQQSGIDRKVKFLEFKLPQIGTSLVTGLTGAPVWGGLNKQSSTSRYSIGEGDGDDLYNFLPMGGGFFIQIPANGSTLITLASPSIWQTEIYLNGQIYVFALSQNGHVYQCNLSGAITDVWQSAQFSENGTLNSTTTVTGINTTNLSVGMGVSGSQIQANTTITQIQTPGVSGAITLSLAATGGGTFSLTFSTPLFTTSGVVDIVGWQSSLIILSDSAAQKVYSWNGTILQIVFNAQPVSYIAVSGNRLWMCTGLTIEWTNANTYNSLSGDSGSYLITDFGCINPINCALDTPYGLFISGSNWFKYITNAQDISLGAGLPQQLTFQQNTIEAQLGPLNKWAVLVIGNGIFFANSFGVFEIQGGQPVQISSPFLNGFFAATNFSNTSLAMAFGEIDSLPCLFVQSYYNGDQFMAAGYTVFGYALQSQQWFRYIQGTISWISGTVSSAVANNAPIVLGSDGTHIWQMFQNNNTSMTCGLNTKLWDFGSVLDLDNILNVAVEFVAAGAATATVGQLDETNFIQRQTSLTYGAPNILNIVNNFGQVLQIINNSSADLFIATNAAASYQLFQDDGEGRVRRCGLNIAITGTGTNLTAIVISYHKTETGRGT